MLLPYQRCRVSLSLADIKGARKIAQEGEGERCATRHLKTPWFLEVFEQYH